MKKWYRPQKQLPVDGWTVWVRIPFFGPGFMAQFSLAAGTFTPPALPPIMWYICDRWKENEWL